MLSSLNFAPGFIRPAGIPGINFSGGGQKAAQVNPAFRRDSMSLGNAAPRFQLYTSPPAPRERWCISNYYTMSPAEARLESQRLWQELENADFSGMTDIEIYDYVENRFIETFGENFMMAHNLGVFDPKSIENPNFDKMNLMNIGNTFQRLLVRHIGVDSSGSVAFPAVNRQRLFGNMNDADVKAAIRARYPENSRLTNRDLQLMFRELNSVGLGIKAWINWDELIAPGVIGPCGHMIARRMPEFFDKRVDFDLMFRDHNRMINNARARGDLSRDMLVAGEFLKEHLGMVAWIDYEELFDRLIRARFQFREVNLEDELLEIMDERDLSVDEVDKQEKEIEYLDNAVEDSLKIAQRTT